MTTSVRWRDIAAPAGRSPALSITALSGPTAATLEVVRRYLVRESGGRTSPSAGNIHPYEIWLRDGDEDSGDVAFVDLSRRCALTTSEASFEQADVLLVLRPWLSVRKYGDRGLAYTLVDVGHAVLNLQLGPGIVPGRASGGPALPAGRLPVGRVPLVATGSAVWQVERVGAGGVVAELGEYEQAFAGRLDWSVPSFAPAPGRTARLAEFLQQRRSASSFAGHLDRAAAEAVLAESTALAGADVTATLYSRADRPDLFVAPHLAYQQHLLSADHIAALSIPSPGPHAPVKGEVAASIMRAGVLGQCAYLLATERGIAITGVGGFAPEPFRGAASSWPIYCLAFGGAPGRGQEKRDVLAPAAAHGYA